MSTFSKLLKNCIFVAYPSGGSGNAFSRILYIHEEFFYWNILFNPWYIYDTNCKKSLDWIETQEHTDIMKDKKVYTPTHLDLRPIQNISPSPIEGETEAEFKNYIYNHANKQLIIDFIKSNKKVILPNHTTTNNLLKNFPANTIINLYSDKKESIKNHRGWKPLPQSLTEKYYWEPHNHPNILNISKEKLFSKNFNEFEKEYKKIISYFNLEKTYTNKIRAFILRYIERCEYYKNMELEITNTFRRLSYEKS